MRDMENSDVLTVMTAQAYYGCHQVPEVTTKHYEAINLLYVLHSDNSGSESLSTHHFVDEKLPFVIMESSRFSLETQETLWIYRIS